MAQAPKPSARYQELLSVYQQLHKEGLPSQRIDPSEMFAGTSLLPHITRIKSLLEETESTSILDYGCGKGLIYTKRDFTLPSGEHIGSLQEYWGATSLRLYDPGYPPHASKPTGQFDAVICTDVLEHIPEDDIRWVLDELFGYAGKLVFANIAAYPASKTLPDGENAHATVRPAEWWSACIAAAAQRRPVDYLFLVTSKGGRGIINKLRGRRSGVAAITNRNSWRTVSR